MDINAFLQYVKDTVKRNTLAGQQQLIQDFAQNNPQIAQTISRAEPAVQAVVKRMENPYKEVVLPEMQAEATGTLSGWNPLMKTLQTGYNYLGKPMVEVLANAPRQYVGGVTRSGEDLGAVLRGEQVNPKQALGNVSDVISGILGAGMIPGVGNVFSGGRVAAQMGEKSLGRAMLTGGVQAGKYGGAYGLTNAIKGNVNTQDPVEYAKNILLETGKNAAQGAVVGAALSGAGYGFEKAAEGLDRKLFKKDAQGNVHKQGKYVSKEEMDQYNSTIKVGEAPSTGGEITPQTPLYRRTKNVHESFTPGKEVYFDTSKTRSNEPANIERFGTNQIQATTNAKIADITGKGSDGLDYSHLPKEIQKIVSLPRAERTIKLKEMGYGGYKSGTEVVVFDPKNVISSGGEIGKGVKTADELLKKLKEAKLTGK